MLRTAATQFIQNGFEATTVRQVATLAGVTTASLYHFFGSKEGLLEELIRGVFATTADLADRAARHDANLHTRASFELAIQLDLLSDDARLAALYNVAHTSVPISRLIIELATRRFAELLRSAHSASDDATAYALAIAAKSAMMGLVQERLLHDRLSLDQRLSIMLGALWHRLHRAESRAGTSPTTDLPAALARLKRLLAQHQAELQHLRRPR